MNDKTSDKLLPCPFCGGSNVGVWRNHPISPLIADSYVVICYDCHFGMCPTSEKGKAISAWNTRKPMEKIVEGLEFQAEKNRDYWNNFDDEYAFGAMNAYTNAIKIVKEELDVK